jgi:hypothetical protein
MHFASGRTREARGSCWSGTVAVEGVRMAAQKKVFGILRKCVRGTRTVLAAGMLLCFVTDWSAVRLAAAIEQVAMALAEPEPVWCRCDGGLTRG